MTDSVRRSQLPLLLVVRWSLIKFVGRCVVVCSLLVRVCSLLVRCWFVAALLSLLRCVAVVLRSSLLVCCWQLAVGSLAVVVVVVVLRYYRYGRCMLVVGYWVLVVVGRRCW